MRPGRGASEAGEGLGECVRGRGGEGPRGRLSPGRGGRPRAGSWSGGSARGGAAGLEATSAATRRAEEGPSRDPTAPGRHPWTPAARGSPSAPVAAGGDALTPGAGARRRLLLLPGGQSALASGREPLAPSLPLPRPSWPPPRSRSATGEGRRGAWEGPEDPTPSPDRRRGGARCTGVQGVLPPRAVALGALARVAPPPTTVCASRHTSRRARPSRASADANAPSAPRLKEEVGVLSGSSLPGRTTPKDSGPRGTRTRDLSN